MSFELEDFNEGAVTVIHIPERLTSDTSDELKKILKEQVEKKVIKIVIDLAKTRYMDSSGLGAIVSKIASTRANNGDIRLASPQQYIIELLELTHINQIIKVFNSVEDAVKSFEE